MDVDHLDGGELLERAAGGEPWGQGVEAALQGDVHESSSPLGRRQEGRSSEHGVCLGSIPGCMQPPLASQSLPIVSRSLPKSSIELQKAAKYFTFFQKISIDFPESGLINGLKGGWAEKVTPKPSVTLQGV
jgi:hypothetical protein